MLAVRLYADRLAEPLQRREVAVAVLRAQERDLLQLLDRARAGDEFAEDRLDGDFFQRPLVRRQDVG